MMRVYNTCLYFILQALTSSSRVEIIKLVSENVGITDRTIWQLSSLILPSSTITGTVPCLTQTVASELPALLSRVQNSMKDCGSAFFRSTCICRYLAEMPYWGQQSFVSNQDSQFVSFTNAVHSRFICYLSCACIFDSPLTASQPDGCCREEGV